MKILGFNIRRKRILILSIIFLCVTGFSQGTSIDFRDTASIMQVSEHDGYTTISPQEAWEMCSTIDDGLHYPIDVRTQAEWLIDRIDTPFPEYSRNFILSTLQTESGLQTFMDEYQGQTVIMYCKAGGRSASAAQILVDNNFDGIIYNMDGGITAWKQANLPTKYGNDPPDKPSQPIGPSISGVGYTAIFQSTGIDPDDDVIRYGWDWNGDGYIDTWSEYVESGDTIELSYSYQSTGVFNITVVIEDIVGERSTMSDKKTVLVTTPPNNPTINGPNKGKVNKDHIFRITSVDNDGDNVYYLINWGDDIEPEWIGPFEQGTTIEISHLWVEEKTYTLQVKAKDIHDIESDWTYHQISLPRIYWFQQFNNGLFNLLKTIFSASYPFTIF